MKIERSVYFKNRKEWRKWLSKNHPKEKEIWLIYYKKSSGKPRIPYNDAVEEALCYGWIDSTVKRIDSERFAQRFSPRRPNSELSQMNKERIRGLIESGKMTKAGMGAVAHAYRAELDHGKVKISKDILKELKSNKVAWENFQKFPESYKRIRIAYIESQRDHSEDAFRKSLGNFIGMTEKNKLFGLVKK